MKWMLVYQTALSKPLDNVSLASRKSQPTRHTGQVAMMDSSPRQCTIFLIVPLLKSVEECWWYCNQLVVVNFPHVYLTNKINNKINHGLMQSNNCTMIVFCCDGSTATTSRHQRRQMCGGFETVSSRSRVRHSTAEPLCLHNHGDCQKWP